MGHLPGELVRLPIACRSVTPGLEHRRAGCMTPTPGVGALTPTVPGSAPVYSLAPKVTRWTSATRAGHWSAENAVCLCQEGREQIFEGKVEVLDRNLWKSLHSAIEALNSGALTVEAGYCIVFAEQRRWYYLLRRDDKGDEVLAGLSDQIYRNMVPEIRPVAEVRQFGCSVRTEAAKDGPEMQTTTTPMNQMRTPTLMPSISAGPRAPPLALAQAVQPMHTPSRFSHRAPFLEGTDFDADGTNRAAYSYEASASAPTPTSTRVKWSTAHSAHIGTDSSCLEKLLDGEPEVLLLGKARWCSVTEVVRALNAGTLVADGGFCVVYSKAKGVYCLVWRSDKESRLAELLPGLPWDQADQYLRHGPEGYQIVKDLINLKPTPAEKSGAALDAQAVAARRLDSTPLPSRTPQREPSDQSMLSIMTPVQEESARPVFPNRFGSPSPRCAVSPARAQVESRLDRGSASAASDVCLLVPENPVHVAGDAAAGSTMHEPAPVTISSTPALYETQPPERVVGDQADRSTPGAGDSPVRVQSDSPPPNQGLPVGEYREPSPVCFPSGPRRNPVAPPLGFNWDSTVGQSVSVGSIGTSQANAGLGLPVRKHSSDLPAAALSPIQEPGGRDEQEPTVEHSQTEPSSEATDGSLGSVPRRNSAPLVTAPSQTPTFGNWNQPMARSATHATGSLHPRRNSALPLPLQDTGDRVETSRLRARPQPEPPALEENIPNGANTPRMTMTVEELHLVRNEFDPTCAATRTQLLQKLGFPETSVIEKDQDNCGNFNEGVWNLCDIDASGLGVVLKLVPAFVKHRDSDTVRYMALQKSCPHIVNETALSFPRVIFQLKGPSGARNNDLIVMRRAPGMQLAKYLCFQIKGGTGPALLPVFKEFGKFLAKTHRAYNGMQHSDCQASNVFYDEPSGTFTLIDVADFGYEQQQIEGGEDDVEHFAGGLRLLSKFYGDSIMADCEMHFRAGYKEA